MVFVIRQTCLSRKVAATAHQLAATFLVLKVARKLVMALEIVQIRVFLPVQNVMSARMSKTFNCALSM